MGLYKLFGSSVEIQYKSCFFSLATLFTLTTTLLNISLPFIIAYRSRGLWLKSYYFYEQPEVKFQYHYILTANTDDISYSILCGDLPIKIPHDDERCAHFQVLEFDNNGDGINDMMDFSIRLNVAPNRSIISLTLMLFLDYRLKTLCPLHMQSLAMINKEFSYPTSGMIYNADLEFHQVTALPCYRNHLDVKYNTSLFGRDDYEANVLDEVMLDYFNREVTTRLGNVYSRSLHGSLSKFDVTLHTRIPEQHVRYKPSFLQEMKWAWPQYLSLVIIFYWIFNKIKCYVFNKQIIMAWQVVPWKDDRY